MMKAAEESASKLSAEADCAVLHRIFDDLDEDHEVVQFLEDIPGFCSSKVVDKHGSDLTDLGYQFLGLDIERFMSHTCSSSLLSDEVKQRRIAVCFQAIDALNHTFPSTGFVEEVFGSGRDEMLGSIQVGHSLR